jgi:hypothetical protein
MAKIVRTKIKETKAPKKKVSVKDKKAARLKEQAGLKKQLLAIEEEKRNNCAISLKLNASQKRKKKRADKWVERKVKIMVGERMMIGAELMNLELVKGSKKHKEIRGRYDVKREEIKVIELMDWEEAYQLSKQEKLDAEEEFDEAVSA